MKATKKHKPTARKPTTEKKLRAAYELVRADVAAKTAVMAKTRPTSAAPDHALFHAAADLSCIQGAFEAVKALTIACVDDNAWPDGAPHELLAIEALAEKGVREIDAVMTKIEKARRAQKAEAEVAHV